MITNFRSIKHYTTIDAIIWRPMRSFRTQFDHRDEKLHHFGLITHWLGARGRDFSQNAAISGHNGRIKF